MMTTTETLTNGEIVVPMSTLFDALDGVLDPGEKAALVAELIKLRPKRVTPGDLISADLFNQILDDINDLMLRVAMLESDADSTVRKPTITGISPSIVRSGELLTVTGTGLGATNLRLIEFDKTPVSLSAIRPGSSDRTLLVAAPITPNLPAVGRSVMLTVGSSAGTASVSYFQLPELSEPFQSSVTFKVKGIDPADAKIAANKTYTVLVDVGVQVNEDEVFNLVGSATGSGSQFVSVEPATISATAETATKALVTPVKLKITTGNSGDAMAGLMLQGRTHASAQGTLNPPYVLTVAAVPTVPVSLVNFVAPQASPGSTFETRAGLLTLVAKKPTDGSPRILLVLTVTSTTAISFDVAGLTADAAGWNPKLESIPAMALGAGGSDDIMISLDSTLTGSDAKLRFEVRSKDGSKIQPYVIGLSAKL
jgi:hypothetical protein